MTYFEDEVPKDLELNGEYSSREIYLFMIENDKVMILSDSVHLDYNARDIMYRVTDKKQNFIHKKAENSYRTHMIPNRKTNIYEISRV
ncbi:hypothetical protein [Rossellomorea vietnamensis]|uniref:hypothetical protein n=1 Tax=Rossellomorea vietnamensis TaxID=218284 RepID=UPI0005504FA7|nr:hypothetical protein [Rossellomorea vietnamensis]